jgi:hypothetical protein
MRFTRFFKIPDVAEKLTPFRPALPRKIAAPLKVKPRTDHYVLVGTAFDYLLRFELQRRAPHAVSGPWIAESAPDTAWHKTERGAVSSLSAGAQFRNKMAVPFMQWDQLAKCFERILAAAKDAVAEFSKTKSPNRQTKEDLAAHSLRLAKLDDVCRSLRLDPHFQTVDPLDVDDLVNLLEIAPIDELERGTPLLLNPRFEESAETVGGVDADLIAGDLLVDFKTTKYGEVQDDYLDQMLGYLLLVRNHHQVNKTFPEVTRLGLYFCRHGHLWTKDARIWTDKPEFSELEQWFINYFKEAARSQKQRIEERLARIKAVGKSKMNKTQ